LKVKKRRKDGYKVIPILLDGVKPSALHHWFGKKNLLAVQIGNGHDAVANALPKLLEALGERAPSDSEAPPDIPAAPSANLTLKLNDLTLPTARGKRRAKATATLIYTPPAPSAPRVESPPYKLTAPLGAIEEGDLTWYLERYAQWPVGVFKERADKVVESLPEWGDDLFEAALGPDAAHEAYEAWKRVGDDTTRRFTIEVDPALAEDPTEAKKKKGKLTKKQQAAQEAATQLLALPWELLHDRDGYLLQGARGIRISRRLPNRKSKTPVVTKPPLRVLLVSPRPEDERTTYIDHRVSARPLVDALTPLGKNVELTLLDPPTVPALEDVLKKAHKAKKPYHVVHFDGHGVYDPNLGLGALCFEDPADADKLEKRGSQIVSAEELADIIRDHRIPLFFLEAPQSAMTKDDPTASVAAKLLQQGVASVVGMSHSVLVETARLFVTEFYDQLMTGATIGQAVLVGRQALHTDTRRGKVFGGGELHLHDWFVPVLFQEEHDPRMIHGLSSKDVAALRRKAAGFSLGDLPARPEHTFVGRSRELLAAERTLATSPYIVFQGKGGVG
ncbi:MAG: CHAT domain-containing protein, partial [Planctomycetota bacterium]|nr:CHAT domain-containing protein [Planctomycetota bacterium]